MHINLHFSQLASRRGVKGAIFAPLEGDLQKNFQFLPFDFLEYIVREMDYDPVKEAKLLALEESFDVSRDEIQKAFHHLNVRVSNKIQKTAENSQANSMEYIGVKPEDGQLYAVFQSYTCGTQIGFLEDNVTLLLSRGSAVAPEGFFIPDHQLIRALAHLKKLPAVANSPQSP